MTTAFILLKCMIIMNLFFGIAVSNVDKVLRDSQMYAQIKLVEMIDLTESTLGRLPRFERELFPANIRVEGSDAKIVVKLDSHEANDREKLRSQSLNQEIKNRLERYVTLVYKKFIVIEGMTYWWYGYLKLI